MYAICKVTLMGNVTRPVELRYTPKGVAVCAVGMAMNRSVPDGNGGYQDKVVFMDVTFWGKQAETVAAYVKQGNLFYIEGELDQEERIVHKGHPEKERKEKKTRVIGRDFRLLPQREKRGGLHEERPPDATGGTAPLPPPREERATFPPPSLEEDEIPF